MTDSPLSAQVILRPHGNASSRGLTITAANVAAYAPDAGTAQRVVRYFAEKGFDVGGVVGISFSISGPPALFEEVFGGRRDRSLVLDKLDSAVAAAIEEVTFTKPPDFGPASY